MKDKFSEKIIALLHPKVRQTFTDFITDCETEFSVTLRITMGLRTIAEQDALYAQGRTTPGNIVTNAMGGTSFHNYGLAIDLVEMVNNDTIADWTYDTSKLKPIADKYGLEWGGIWVHIKDRPHFENRFGFKEDCSDLLALVKAGNVDSNGYVIF